MGACSPCQANTARHVFTIAAPTRMTDGAPAEFVPLSAGIDPGDRVDAAIVNTCRAVFPRHGLSAPM